MHYKWLMFILAIPLALVALSGWHQKGLEEAPGRSMLAAAPR